MAGVLFLFLFNPNVGTVRLCSCGPSAIGWNHALERRRRRWGWSSLPRPGGKISYNFLFFLAGMQAIPKSLIEAAAIDGAGSVRRFWTIIFPLLTPTTFFLLVMNIVYAFFETFGIIHQVT